jgi:C4-dicarboxylate-binding protein DctP
MSNYIPMLSETFWGGLTPALKTLVTDLWAANIGIYRANLAGAQDKAEKELRVRGIRLSSVPAEELAEQRQLMLEDQDRVAREMKISPDILARITEAVADTN